MTNNTQQEELSDKDKIAKIKERVKFFSNNKKMPAIFRFKRPGSSAISNASDSSIYLSTPRSFPNDFKVEYADGPDDMPEQHRIVYDGASDIHKGYEKYKNGTTGQIEIPASVPMIEFTGDTLRTQGDSAKGLKLIEFLSYIEFFYSTKGLVEFSDNTISHKEEVDQTALVVSTLDTIKRMSAGEEGYAYLVKMAKNAKINSKALHVDALLSTEGAKGQIVSMLQSRAIAKPVEFNKLFLPFDDEKKMFNTAKEKGVLDFNKAKSAYQLKDAAGEFVADGIIYSTKEKDPVVAKVLLLNEIRTNPEVKEKLSFYLK